MIGSQDSGIHKAHFCLLRAGQMPLLPVSAESEAFRRCWENAKRKQNTTTGEFLKKSYKASELAENADYELDFIIAPPQMAKYMEKSTEIYNVYLRYIAPEDIHVYSIDEVFIDATNYLKTYNMTAVELAGKMIRDVFNETEITATAGVGTNLYLCKNI